MNYMSKCREIGLDVEELVQLMCPTAPILFHPATHPYSRNDRLLLAEGQVQLLFRQLDGNQALLAEWSKAAYPQA